ncbi:MAG TPA: FAD-binding domain [Terrimesophilobacter sp.]|nr:FAD-binding domain [Terrimesophilobacter sp.]
MRVLISGAGIAGPTLAYWLLRSGHEVTIVEHAPELRKGGYLVDFWGAGFDVAEQMGIVPELRRRGYVFTDLRAIDRRGRLVASVKPAKLMRSGEHYLTIARSNLSEVIYDALDGQAELILGDSVVALEDDGTTVRVDFESGSTREFDLVVGADGLHSRVRRLAFGPDYGYEKYLGIVFAAFEATGYRPRDELVAMMYADIGFQALRLTLDDDNALFLLSARHEGAVPEDRVAQEQVLRTALGEGGWEVPAILELMPKAKEFFFDSVSQIRMPSWSSGRVALVGDAGAAPSFLAGQGSALAMVGAYVLAVELARTGDHVAAFARYEERLAPLIRSKQDAAEGLGVAFAPKNRRELFLRNTAMRVMGLPGMADLVMGRSFRDAVELPPFAETRSIR